MNVIFKLWPPDHWSLRDVTVAVLSKNITFWQNRAPHIQLRHGANKRLVWIEASAQCVLVLSDDCGTSMLDSDSLLKLCSLMDEFTIFVELIVSVSVAPCETDMVPLAILNSNAGIPFKQEFYQRVQLVLHWSERMLERVACVSSPKQRTKWSRDPNGITNYHESTRKVSY